MVFPKAIQIVGDPDDWSSTVVLNKVTTKLKPEEMSSKSVKVTKHVQNEYFYLHNLASSKRTTYNWVQ